MIPYTAPFFISDGFFPSQAEIPGRPNTFKTCTGLWLRGPALWVADRGYSSVGAPAIAAAANPMMVSNGVPAGLTGGGTVTRHATVPWAAGSGTAVEGSLVLGAVAGQLMLYVGGTLVTAGLTAPTKPTFVISGTAGSKLNGSYSICVSGYRSTTGAVSSRSVPSDVISPKNKKATVTFPTPPTGATHWIIWGSRRGFGSVGPWFRITTYGLTDIPVSTTSLDIEWFDGELGDIAPTNYDPPPSGVTHCAGLGGCMITIGPNGRVSPSIIGKPEAFPPEFVTNIPSRETVTGVTGRSTDGIIYIATANSLGALVLSGSDLTPVLPRGIWENTGFASGSAFCLVEDQIYGMAGGGPVRTHGGEAPDRSFAAPVLQDMLNNGWTSANTTVVYAPDNHAVYYCKGTQVYAFMLAGEEENRWSGVMTVPSVTTGVTVSGVGYVASGATLYALDRAGGTATTPLGRTPFIGGPEGHVMKYKTLRNLRVGGSASATVKVHTNLAVNSTISHSHTGPHSAVKKNKKAVHSFAFEVSGLSAGAEAPSAELDMLIEPMHTSKG